MHQSERPKRIGDRVRLIHGRDPGKRSVVQWMNDGGGCRVDPVLGGYYTWNVHDLEVVGPDVDYKALLRKYMAAVVGETGVSFWPEIAVAPGATYTEESGLAGMEMTPEELETIKAMAIELKAGDTC